MEVRFFLLLLLLSLPAIRAEEVERARIIIDGNSKVSETDNNFICATLDWWPPGKCDYNQCPWGHSSVINLNLSHPLLSKAILAFKNLRIRIGGSLQDQVLYDVESLKSPCRPFQKTKSGLFGFSKGCLHMKRWDALNHFFRQTGAIVTFGLNALYGRHKIRQTLWGGNWDYRNALGFMNYTISKRHVIDSWEFGNELSGSGVGARVAADQYAKDLIKLKSIIDELYQNSNSKPSLVAPGGFYDQQWYAKLLKVSGPNVINVVTHHMYNLGPGVDRNLVRKILDPNFLSRASETFSKLDQTIQTNGPWPSAWVGESGGAYNSGGRHVSDTFVNSFWYLDQLGMAAKYRTKVYCRQSLIGGNYGLLNTNTFVPNPDFYSALLWHRLMGTGVLAVGGDADASSFLRSYAHCSKGRAGVTVLFINLSNATRFVVSVRNSLTIQPRRIQRESPFMDGIKKTVAWIGNRASDLSILREEYHLTPKDGYLQSQTMVLNGAPLELNEDGEIPELRPVLNNVNSPLLIAPLSMAFIVFPNFDAPLCK